MTVPVDATPAEHARAALASIEADPAGFDMGCWFYAQGDDVLLAATEVEPHCGTTMCAAGWIAHNAGFDLMEADGDVIADQEGYGAVEVGTLGAQLLGLTTWQANDLFTTSNGRAIGVLRRYANGETWPDTVPSAGEFDSFGAQGAKAWLDNLL